MRTRHARVDWEAVRTG